MAKLAVIIVIVAISSLSTSGSEECQSLLSKESFSCCLYNIDLVDYTKCQFETENCSAGIDWTRSEDDCGTLNENTMEFGNSFGKVNLFDFHLNKIHKLHIFSVKCHGRKDLQSPDTNFKWTCPKPDTGNVKAEIILAPETGTLELTGDDFRFTSTLANAFPVPQSDLKFDQETACLEKKTSNVHMNKSGLITVTDHFLVRVKAEVADVKVIVIQEGFDNRTFDYMLSYPDFASGGNNTDGNDGPNVTGIVLGVLIPVCILIGGGVAAYICYKRRLLCFATPATRVVGHTSQMDRTANRYRERNEYVTSAPPSGSGMVNPSFDDSNYVEIDLNDSGEGVANLNNSRTSGPMSDYVSRVAARYPNTKETYFFSPVFNHLFQVLQTVIV